MLHAPPEPLLRRLGALRPRRNVLDAGDFGTEFGMEIFLSQRPPLQRPQASRRPALPARWWRRLAWRFSAR